MTTEAFASFSDTAIMFAGIVYVLALVAHVAEWVVALTSPGAKATLAASDSTASSDAAAASVAAGDHADRAAQPVAVGAAGVSGGSGAPGGDATLGDVPRDGGAAAGDERRELRIETASRIGVALTVVAAVLHLAGVVSRSFASDPWRVPWGNMYEFTLTGALGVTLIYLLLLRTLRLRWMGLFLTLFEVVVLMLANLTLEQQAGPLVPALHSYWLVIHVGAAILATGAFAVGALTSVMFLVKSSMGERRAALLDRFPDADTLDRISYRLHAVGFPLWTFAALIAGPIWAEYAWGSYWNWDPKEVWAFITWVVYAAYLHARATAGWKGKGAAIIALIGFATLLFNFVGINFFFGASSLHSYAGS